MEEHKEITKTKHVDISLILKGKFSENNSNKNVIFEVQAMPYISDFCETALIKVTLKRDSRGCFQELGDNMEGSSLLSS